MTNNKITFLREFNKYYQIEKKFGLFRIIDHFSVHLFLDSLGKNKIFCVYPELINIENKYNLNNPKISLSQPILVSYKSNDLLIYKFIDSQYRKVISIYFLNEIDDRIFNETNSYSIVFRIHELITPSLRNYNSNGRVCRFNGKISVQIRMVF
jgi:hypothetical protein